jgi:hypothetical protein
MQNIRNVLLAAPPEHLHPSILCYIKKWSDVPKAIEVLQVLDLCIFSSLGSDFAIRLLQLVYDSALEIENIVHEEVLINAHWRNVTE